MPTIKNTTKKALNVPLPGGKRLFLGPGKEGQITPKAGEHAPILALVEAGDLEVLPEDGRARGRGRGSGSGASGQSYHPTKTVFKSGDG